MMKFAVPDLAGFAPSGQEISACEHLLAMWQYECLLAGKIDRIRGCRSNYMTAILIAAQDSVFPE